MHNLKLTSGLLGLALAGMTVHAAAPSLSYEVSGNDLIITYTGTLLRSSDAVNWTEVASASSPYKVALSDKKLFFCTKGATSKDITIPLSDMVDLDLIWIEPGTFLMGSPEDELGRLNIETQHKVTLTQGYWLGKYEITQAQYEAVTGTNPSSFKGGDLPVDSVSWNDAKEFCAKLNAQEKAAGRLPEGYKYTLPTEAQWEYACRAGTTTAFNNGTNIPTIEQAEDEFCPNLDEVGWYIFNSEKSTHPAGQKMPNAWGLYDMHGNVFEWCLDRFGDYPIKAVTDPVGPATGSERIARGGGYPFLAWGCRSAFRAYSYPDTSGNFLGFRVALTSTKDITIPLSNNVNLDLIWIEPGTFTMGSPEGEMDRFDDEVQHEVTLTRGYWLGKYEITQAQYRAIMPSNPSEFMGADLPVECVSWEDAMEFCKKLTAKEQTAGRLPAGYEYTLPTEAQWEYACRAGTTTALNSGKNLSNVFESPEVNEVGWYIYNSDVTTHPAGQKQPNAWGLYDMHGNVYEWCLDWYGAYPAEAVTDPTGPETGSNRVVRGGGWNVFANGCRSAYRDKNTSALISSNYGFRVALVNKNITIPLSDKVDLDMVWINPGTFTMGSPSDELGRDNDEVQHKVTLTQGYWLGKYEITQAQYKAVMKVNPSQFIGADLPVETVSWNDAIEFCEKLTEIEKAAGRLPEGYEYTLPTEAQWEYACRAGTTTAFNNGTNIPTEEQIDKEPCPNLDEVGWYEFNSDETTHPAGQKKPNAWGLYDMHGNVYEWCLDWYGKYPTSSVTDPTGPATGSNRVMRGGSWTYNAYGCRSAFRNYGSPDRRSNDRGFRVALVNKNITIPLAKDVELDMIWINPGTFTMGSPSDELGRWGDEVQHQVTLTQGYWLGKFEVTQAQYEVIMGTNPSDFKGADRPVEKVSWNDAMKFCKKLTEIGKASGKLPFGYEFTLPTESQWEYACRAGTTTALNSGKNLSDKVECPEMDEVGWYKYNSDDKTHPVGQKQPNAWGLYDMHGNVFEWCLDWFGDYPTSSVTDPTGPSTGSARVVRGGSWDYSACNCRSANRINRSPDSRNAYYGFRVALAPVQ